MNVYFLQFNTGLESLHDLFLHQITFFKAPINDLSEYNMLTRKQQVVR